MVSPAGSDRCPVLLFLLLLPDGGDKGGRREDTSSSSVGSDRSSEEHRNPCLPIPSIISVPIHINTSTMAPQQSSGRKSGTLNYGIEETKHLFDIMEKILPIGTDEWKSVLDQHSIEYSGRSVLSIRRRYQNLHRKQAPTGSPNMPEDVRQAKRIKYKIGKRAELCDGTEEFHLDEGFKTSSVVEEPNVDTTGTGDPPESTQTTQPTVQSTIEVLDDAATNTAGSTITPSKRSYTSRASTSPHSFPGGDRFLHSY